MTEKRNKCDECGKSFATKRGLKDHKLAKHTDYEPSFASRLIDAQIDAAMGNYVDDDLVDHL